MLLNFVRQISFPVSLSTQTAWPLIPINNSFTASFLFGNNILSVKNSLGGVAPPKLIGLKIDWL